MERITISQYVEENKSSFSKEEYKALMKSLPLLRKIIKDALHKHDSLVLYGVGTFWKGSRKLTPAGFSKRGGRVTVVGFKPARAFKAELNG